MANQQFNLWKQYQANGQRVSRALDLTLRSGKEAVRRRDQESLFTLQRLALLLLAAHTENRLNEIIWYYSHVSSDDRARLEGKSIEERWLYIIDLGFSKRRGLPLGSIPGKLRHTDSSRREELRRIVIEHVSPIVNARNAIAHGGWNVAMMADGSAVDPRRTATIKKYSLWRTIIERNLLHHFTWMVHDLVITDCAHERDFDQRMSDLQAAQGRLIKGRDAAWQDMLRQRFDRRPTRRT